MRIESIFPKGVQPLTRMDTAEGENFIRARLTPTHKAPLLIGLVQPWVYLLAPLALRSNTPFIVGLLVWI